jgi:integrase
LTFIAGQRGKPMVKEAFATWFHKACAAAGLKGKNAHGIRKAAATADAEAGWTDAELDAKFGWTGRKMAAHYTRAANRERLSLAAAERTKKGMSIPAPEGQGAGASSESPMKSSTKK